MHLQELMQSSCRGFAGAPAGAHAGACTSSCRSSCSGLQELLQELLLLEELLQEEVLQEEVLLEELLLEELLQEEALLEEEEHSGKPLFRVVAELEGGTVMAVVSTGDGRDEALMNISTSPAAWAMYKLLLKHGATTESTETALSAWFTSTHKKAAVEYSEYEPGSGRISLLEDLEEDEQGKESQEAIAEGLLDLSILDKPSEITKGAMASGRLYDSDNLSLIHI